MTTTLIYERDFKFGMVSAHDILAEEEQSL
jgi:hypothetical protein